MDPDAFFTASAPAHNAPDSHSSLSLSPPSTAAAPPSGSMGLVQALVVPGSGPAGPSCGAGADGGARTGGVGLHDGLGADMLSDVLSDKQLDLNHRHSHAHLELACDQEAAQQSPASCTSKLVAYYTTCDKMQDAMDVLAESPASPSEAHGKLGVDESKQGPPSPARSTGSVGKLNHLSVLDVEEICSASLRTGSRSPALQSMDGQHQSSAILAQEFDKLDPLESDPNVRPASLDPMLSALI